ncbi:DUF2141 domain-containing protein [Uliginosibacterium gangwonense]|uniref:DUF2141 domain-containing protein n=1 Tax=Uliginosibacterium gangwonense TaxID=392736 RepID=UPI00037FBC3E|nr:DUF2141 domain-containing protein [Uliginosibacterium gangwonense]
MLRPIIAMLSLACCVTSQAGEIRVHFTNLSNQSTPVMVAVFATQDQYQTKHPYRGQKLMASQNLVADFPALPPGDYVVAAYQDDNGNGMLDRNDEDWPMEPYGFGHRPTFTIGAPSFAQLAIHLENDGTQELDLALH